MTSPRNAYATLSEFKAFVSARGEGALSTDAQDDGVINSLLAAASRYIDGGTSRRFYPTIETMYYSVPAEYGRDIWLKADVLEVLSFLNGDGTSIASSSYFLEARNFYPKYQLVMKELSTVTWEFDSDGESEYVLAMNAITGYHDKYSLEAWENAGTLGAAISTTTEKTFTFSANHTMLGGRIIRIDDEIMILDSTTATTGTVLARGDNGSTATTHSNGATVKMWRPMPDVNNAVLETVNTAYKRRFGESMSNVSTMTASGIMLAPRDIPMMAQEFIKTYARRAL